MDVYLTFSDGAKYAIIARNLFEGKGFVTDFSFWGGNLFSAGGIPHLIPYSILPFFKILGVSDFAVAASSFFYFLLLVVFVFFLAKKIYGPLVGALSSLALAANLSFLDYATSGASEPAFTAELVLGLYLLTLKRRLATVLSLLVIILMYFTRPQAFIFIAGLFFYWLLVNFGLRKSLIMFFGLGVVGILLDRFLIYPLSFKYPLTPVFYRGLQSIYTYSSTTAVSDSLRGGAISTLGLTDVIKKVFYNLYNFYRLLPQIASPYMWGLFAIGLFVWSKDRLQNSLKITTIFMVVITFLVTALTIPFFRYLHPVVPLVYLVAVSTLVWIVGEITKSQTLNSKQIQIPKLQKSKNKLLGFRILNLGFDKEKAVILISSFLVFFFVVGQTLGVVFLDSRFKAKQVNKGKPPVYVQLSWLLRDNTSKSDVIITNLDTWGSWYGERKTIWFPLKPDQLIPPEGKEDPFDAIYLTSYLMDDENYFMGDKWRQMFFNPEIIEDKFIAENYELKGVYVVKPQDSYEKQEARAVLFKRKD